MRVVAVTGYRKWKDSKIIEEALEDQLQISDCIFLHGDAAGADRIVKDYCNRHGILHTEFEAAWELGRKAGPLRNREMLNEEPDVLLGFPDPSSKGTFDCLVEAMKRKIEIIVYYEEI